ncbi:MAG: ROK family protein [Sulfitobacter sp.]
MDGKLIEEAISPAKTNGCGPLLRSSQDMSHPLRQQVFEFVRGQGQAARADITHALGISAGSATTLTADLINCGYLREFEHQAKGTGRGRPKVALEVVAEAAYVIGIKLAFKQHTGVLADFSGNVIASAALPAPDGRRSREQLLNETETLIAKLLIAGGKAPADIKSVGIGLPGIIDHNTGSIIWSSLLDARDVDLKQAFAERFDIPMALDNDANMVTLAELWFGQGRSIADFAVVTVESGVGMGLVLGNQLYRGGRGMGLELGHTKVQMDGALCQCGQRGCLEAYLADYALIREATTALGHSFDRGETPEEILDTLFNKAKAGHPAAETIFLRAGQFLSLGLSNVVQLFDPALIILSGERMKYAQHYAEEMIESMRMLTLNEGRRPCRVAISDRDDLIWARGASALALSDMTTRVLNSEARTS